jgi:outer membrane protein OmpA-like peptidoglycan-associated protein
MLHSSKLELKKLIDSEQIKTINGLFGYTDTTASKDYNISLAEKRVLDIQYFLLSNKIKLSTNFTSHAVGEDFKHDDDLAQNRKVIIQYESNVPESNGLKKLKKGEILSLKHLNFHPGSDEFRDIAYPVLKELLNILKEREDIKIKIHGHICCYFDDIGDLSTKRALKVGDFLINNGIDRKRVTYEGHGSSKPIYSLPEKNEEQMKANRRVEIEIISTKQ